MSLLFKLFNKSYLPEIFIILAGIFIFLSEKPDGGAIEGSISDGTSAHGLVLSKNIINSDHPLFMYSTKEFKNGKIEYEGYNRFPFFSFLLTGLLISPFEENINLQIYFARQLMNLFFFISMFFAFKVVNELTKNKYLAVTVSLLAFSSYYLLSYHNMIFNDIPSLLGCMVLFYGILKAQREKLTISKIIFYSIFPICLGWQPYAVLITWLLIETIEVIFKEKNTIKEKIIKSLKSPACIITALAIIWGTTILIFQLWNEWRIVGGTFTEIPSVSSALWKSGITSAEGKTSLLWTFEWLTFLPGQCHIIATMLIPFWPIFQVDFGFYASVTIVLFFIILLLFKYYNNPNPLNKMILIMLLSGFFWTLPMRHFVALHDFQSIFYIGFVLAVYVLLFSNLKFTSWNLIAFNITVLFIVSVSLTNYYKPSHSNKLTNQLSEIRKSLPKNSKIFFDGDRRRLTGFSRFAYEFYLIGNTFTDKREADYAISFNTQFNNLKLTSNQKVNLFKIDTKIKSLRK